jgi:hypothetical protein
VTVVYDIAQIAASGRGAAQHAASATENELHVDRLGRRALASAVHQYRPDCLLWDVATGKQVKGAWLALHDDGVHGLRVDGNAVTFRAIESGAAIAKLPFAASEMPRSLALCPDAPFAVAGTTVFALRTGKTRELDIPAIHASAFVSGGRLVVLDRGSGLSLWDLDSGARIREMARKREPAGSLVVDADGKRAIAYAKRLRFELWDVETGELVVGFDASDVHAAYMKWAKQRRLSLVGSATGPTRPAWLVDGGKRLLLGAFGMRVLDVERLEIRFAVVATTKDRIAIDAWPLAGGRHVAVLGSRELLGGGAVEIWDVDARAMIGRHSLEVDDDAPQEYPRTMAVAGDTIVIGYDDGIRTLRLARRDGKLPAQPPLEDFTTKLRAEPLALARIAITSAPRAAPRRPRRRPSRSP